MTTNIVNRRIIYNTPGGGGGGGPVVITFKSSGTDETNSTTITFTGKALSTTGYNVVAVGGSGLGVGTWATCTIDGVSATLLTQIAQGANHQMATFIASSSGAASGTIVLTSASFAMNFVVMGLWGMTGTTHPTPADTQTDQNLTSSLSLAIPTSGAAIAFNYGVNNNSVTFTGGLSAADFGLTTTASIDGNGAHTNTGGTQTVGCSVTGGTEVGNIYTAWGP